jgi:type IV pilus assembly protein PilE
MPPIHCRRPCSNRRASPSADRARTPRCAGAARGFTLIELMIVVAIAGVLGSLALPSFEAPLQKARRSDVLVATMQVQAAQERLRGNEARYGNLAELGVATVTPNGHYRLALEDATPDGYVLLATATGPQARDLACRHMKLTSTRLNLAHASGPDTGVANADAVNRKCWNL